MRWRILAAACAAAWALMACGGGDPAPTGAGGTTPPPTATSADVSISVVGPTSPIASGAPARLQVEVTNAGPDAALDVTVAAQLPAGVSIGTVSCSAIGVAACPPDPASFSVPSLPANAGLRFTVDAVVPAATRGRLSGTVSVTASNDAQGAASPWTVDAFVADLFATGAAAAPEVHSGGQATYVMTVGNAGPDTAHGVVIENVLDPRHSLVTMQCSPVGGATCPTAIGSAMQVDALPSGGALTFTVTATVSAEAIGSIANTIYVRPDGDPAPANNAASASATASIPTSGARTFIQLSSDPGDYIGAGMQYSYTKANASLNFTATGGRLAVQVDGDENWFADFQLPAGITQLQPGTYTNLTRYPFHGSSGGLSWSGEGRGCNTLTGTVWVDRVVYVGGTLSIVDLRFEQHCEGGSAALHGQIHWDAADTTVPPGPVTPPPAGLWAPAPGATPATGNYVHLQSDPGDHVGGGATTTYTQANSVLGVTLSGGLLRVEINGNTWWYGNFQAMNSIGQLQPGYYPSLGRHPFHNPVRGGLDWSGSGRGCNTLSGWFVVDNITFNGTALASIDLRFEQHCEHASAALRGKVHWIAGDATVPPGPQAPPANLWAPAAGATPASGNYVYLKSDSGDYIGQGQTYVYTPSTASVALTTSGNRLGITVDGVGGWTGTFMGMNSIARLEPGYYPNLQRWPFHNPTTGGLDWSGHGRGCNTLTGWFVVDSVTYVGTVISSIDLRFEQHCEGGGPALRGKIHWIG